MDVVSISDELRTNMHCFRTTSPCFWLSTIINNIIYPHHANFQRNVEVIPWNGHIANCICQMEVSFVHWWLWFDFNTTMETFKCKNMVLRKKPVQKTRKSFLVCAAVLRTSKTTLEKPWTKIVQPSNIKSWLSIAMILRACKFNIGKKLHRNAKWFANEKTALKRS